jgi:hypothetical protein
MKNEFTLEDLQAIKCMMLEHIAFNKELGIDYDDLKHDLNTLSVTANAPNEKILLSYLYDIFNSTPIEAMTEIQRQLIDRFIDKNDSSKKSIWAR